MKLLVSFASVLCILLPAVQAAAQKGGRTCQYDLECGPTQSCNDYGRCISRGVVDGHVESAEDECGTDRRCRLDRLARKNAARRHAKTIREEEQVRDILAEEEEERLKERPRLKDPLSADLRISRLGASGAHIGYVFFGRLQPEFEFIWSSLYAYTPSGEDGAAGLDGYHDGWFFRFGATYFLLESWFSPYLSAGFQLGTGQFQSYSYDLDFDFVGSSNLDTKFHAAEVGGGMDLQFAFGMHTRLGLAYRPLIYNQARYGPGSYDPTTRQGLARWYKQAAGVDIIWLIGWAI